jgi:hypothetical protein
MSSRLPSNYQPSSGLDRGTILTESVRPESIYSESHYPLKKLSRYSDRRSPNQSYRSANDSYINSKISQNSRRTNKKSNKRSEVLDEAYYPSSMRDNEKSLRSKQSYYSRNSQNTQKESLKQVRNFKKSGYRDPKSQREKISQKESYYSKKSISRITPDQESQIVRESDYEQFLRERYPDMASSSQKNDIQKSQQTNSRYNESKYVTIFNNFYHFCEFEIKQIVN